MKYLIFFFTLSFLMSMAPFGGHAPELPANGNIESYGSKTMVHWQLTGGKAQINPSQALGERLDES